MARIPIRFENEDFTFGIIGPGKLGMVLARELSELNRLEWVLARSENSVGRLERLFGSGRHIVRDFESIDKLPNMVIITVNDSQITKVAKELSEQHSQDIKGKYFVHCSGVVGKEALVEIEKLGGIVASVHPFQTFVMPEDDVLKDIRWGVDADDDNYDTFANFVTFLYGFPIRINNRSQKEKALYHAVAVAASNYMTTIVQLANNIADSANIDAKEFLPPIAKTTLGNNLRALSDKQPPLSGPVARGDIETIKLHIDAMLGNEDILTPYCLMGLATAKMAYSSALISEVQYLAMNELLSHHVRIESTDSDM